jgi:predicted amidohydrolase YtcJ
MKPGAGLLITNARVWTDGRVDERADAIAVAGGRVLAVGREAELEPLLRSNTGRLDAAGATVTPGLVDSHLHLLAWARSLDEVALAGVVSRREALARIAAFLAAEPGGGPVTGRGWDACDWSEAPERASLDAVSGGRPVLLHSKDYHALWVNSAALRDAGVDRDTPDPPGGRIERDGTGEPTGIVREHAVRFFAGLEAGAVRGSDLERLARATQRLHRHGVTMVHDFEGVEALRLLRTLTRGPGPPSLRVVAHLPHAGLEAALALGLESGAGDDRFRYGAVKLFADGTLGSRTAALLDPYEGGTETGMDLMSPAELARAVAQAATGGLSVAIHAIGDRAVRSALDAIEASAQVLARLALSPRIEHVQLLDPADRPRFARLGVWASLQPSHCVADLEIAGRGWGARVERSYPWRSLLEAGASVAFGSDAPVEVPIPALGLHAALTRQRVDGTPAGGFTPGERIGLDPALRAYTSGGAALAGRSAGLGRIAPGCAADLVVWDADLHRLPASLLHEARPACTLLAGEVVFPGSLERQPEVSSLRQDP